MATALAPAASSHRVLLAGRLDGWQGVHWHQVESAFLALGHECRSFDYRAVDVPGLLDRFFPGDRELRLRKRRSEGLIRAIRDYQPTLVVLHNHRFDMPRLREATQATLAWWDVDGPAGALGTLDLSDALHVDLIATVSRPILRRLEKHSRTPAIYLANGVDTQFYTPGKTSESEKQRFDSRVAFLGQPSERRLDLLETHANDDLVVWGRRWTKATKTHAPLRRCVRESNDLVGEEVVALYRCAGMMLNISREPFTAPPTTLNLQVFHIPSTGGCVLTEWVEELEEAFEPGNEVLCFRSADELAEQIARYSVDRVEAHRIGQEGRRRCEAQHTLRHRVDALIAEIARIL